MNLKLLFARNTLVGWLSNLLSVGSALVLTPMVIHGVGAQAYGIWILINQISGYAGILDLGIQPAVTKYVARARAVEDRGELQKLLSSALSIHTAIACIVFAALFLFSFFLERCFSLGNVSPSDARNVLLIAGAGTALGFPASVLSGVLRGFLRIDHVNWIAIVVNTLRFLGVLLALKLDRGIVGLAWVSLAANALGLMGGFVFLHRDVGRGFIAPAAVSKAACRTLFSFGILSFIGTLGWYFSFASNAMVIGATLEAEDIAHFGLAVNVITILGSVAGVIAATVMPLASDYEARGDHDRIRYLYYFGTRLTLLVVLPLVFVLLVEGPALLSLWVGPDFGRMSGTLLQLLVLAHLPILVNGPGVQIAMGADLQRQVAVLSLAQGIFILPLSYSLCRMLGVEGAAIATLAVSTVINGVAWPHLLWSKYQISIHRFWSDSLKPVFLPLIPALVVGQPLAWILGRGTALATLGSTLATLLAYCLLVMMLNFPAVFSAYGRTVAGREKETQAV